MPRGHCRMGKLMRMKIRVGRGRVRPGEADTIVSACGCWALWLPRDIEGLAGGGQLLM